ncbi:MAG: transglutaminase family protein [Pseudomonadota bacterium]
MRFRVRHISTLTYAAPVSRARFNLRLKPRPGTGQRMESESLTIAPKPSSSEEQSGPYWVTKTQIGFEAPIKKLQVTSEFVIDQAAIAPVEAGPSLERVRSEALDDTDLSDLAPAPYSFASRIATMSDEITAWATPLLAPGGDSVAAISALMRAIHTQFTYAPGKTNSRTPPQDAFTARHGVCQDFAHVMIMGLRAAGIPAAYVSGYLLTRPPPGKPKLVGADAMHAWVAAWCGRELGWIGFDPTNACLAGEDHIAIAMGRDYADVSPIDGTFIGNAPQSMASAVDVERLA